MVMETAAEDLEPPVDLLDAIYDDFVQVHPGTHSLGLIAQWAGASDLRLVDDDEHDSAAPDAPGASEVISLCSSHDGVCRKRLAVVWPTPSAISTVSALRLQAACDHIATALSYREKLLASRRLYEVFADGLDRLSIGAMTLEEGGQPIDANGVARQILDRRDGLSIIGGKVCAAGSADQKAMRQLIDSVLAGKISQGGIQIRRPSGEPDLYVLVLASPPCEGVMRGDIRILLRDPSLVTVHSRTALMDLHGLTEAEAAITLELANGRSPEKVEEDFSIRHNTMRAHLRAIYAKLDVKSQAHLVYAVLTGAGALVPEENEDFAPHRRLAAAAR